MPKSIQADNNNITTNLRSGRCCILMSVVSIVGSFKEQNKELGLNLVVLKEYK
jgi:hypothetical protein